MSSDEYHAKELRDNVSLLHANILLRAPLPVIQFLCDFSPDEVTKEVVSSAFFEAAPGSDFDVFRFLVEKYKSKFSDDEDHWKDLVEEVERLLTKNRRLQDFSAEALEEFMETFPELIVCPSMCKSGRKITPIEFCFAFPRFTTDRIKHFANKIATNTNFTYGRDSGEYRKHFVFHTGLGAYNANRVFNGDYMEGLAVVMTKAKYLRCDKANNVWTTGGINKFIRCLLFQQTNTVEDLTWNVEQDFNQLSGFSASVEQIIASVKEEQIKCPIQNIKITVLEDIGTSPLFPFLPYMNELRTLAILVRSQKQVDWDALQQVVSNGRLETLSIRFYFDVEPVHTIIIPIMEAARHSRSLKDISIAFYYTAAAAAAATATIGGLRKCMLDILQQNTVLTSATVRGVEDSLSKKINHLTYLNRYGRGGIRQETTTLLQFLSLLGDLDEDEQQEENMKTSTIYGLLRERPSLWIETVPRGRNKCTGKRKRCN